MKYLFIVFSTIFLVSCSSPPKVEAPVQNITVPKDDIFLQSYIQRLENMCYAQIQRVVGETRAGRGIIWAECLDKNIKPIEQRNFPEKISEINAMYAALIEDMRNFYRGETTLALLQERWTNRQRTIGYETIRSFRDSYL